MNGNSEKSNDIADKWELLNIEQNPRTLVFSQIVSLFHSARLFRFVLLSHSIDDFLSKM